jgi:hypothetical protein
VSEIKKDFSPSYIAQSSPLTEEEIKAWQSILPPHSYLPEQILFYAGHHPYGVIIICDGMVSLLDKHDQPTDLHIQSGNMVGLHQLILKEPFVFTGKAVNTIQAIFAVKTLFFNLIRQNSRLLPHASADLKKKSFV